MGMLADFEVSYAHFQLCILFLDCALGALHDFAVQKKIFVFLLKDIWEKWAEMQTEVESFCSQEI